MDLREIEPTEDDEAFIPRVYRTKTRIAIIAPTFKISTVFRFSNFLEEYKKNPQRALRDFGSVPSYAIEALFRVPELLDIRANPDRRHPIRDDGTFGPELVPGKFSYFIHVDLSVRRDATGIAMAHWDRYAVVDVPLVGRVRGRVVLDFALEIEPQPGHEIDMAGVREMIIGLKLRGFYIKRVTYDGFQSLDSQQQLRRRGLEVGQVSVDRNTSQYDTYYETVINGKLDYYHYEPLITQSKRLIVKNNSKVDHPPKGKKDVSDAVASVVAQAIEHSASEPAMEITSNNAPTYAGLAEYKEQREREALLGFADNSQSSYY